VPARLPLAAQRLVIVTGKGGVGKSAVTAALARALAGAGRRVLAVEVAHGGLGPLLGFDGLKATPRLLAPRLQAATPEPAEAVALRERIELHGELVGRLGRAVAQPIVNALPPRRFGPDDEAALARLEGAAAGHPWVLAARHQVEHRRRALAQVATLRRALRTPVIRLPFLFAGPEAAGGVARLASDLAAAATRAA